MKLLYVNLTLNCYVLSSPSKTRNTKNILEVLVKFTLLNRCLNESKSPYKVWVLENKLNKNIFQFSAILTFIFELLYILYKKNVNFVIPITGVTFLKWNTGCFTRGGENTSNKRK